MDSFEKIAVLIDADNTQLSKIEAVLNELSANGRIVVKKAYGNWKKPIFKHWESELKRLAIKAEQQFDYVAGKNTTDIAMVIDAMDLLHANMYDAFALVSSDSDFTPLAIRLRESGAHIIGAGESRTPEAFKNACDDFILLEYVSMAGIAPVGTELTGTTPTDIAVEKSVSAETVLASAAPNKAASNDKNSSNIDEIHNLLKIASAKYQDADGFVNIASAGQYIKRAKPDFTPLTYGVTKLPELLAMFPEKYKMHKFKGKGTVTIVAYKCI